MIAIQEAIERLVAVHRAFDEDDNEQPDATQLSFPSQLEILIDLYSACASISLAIRIITIYGWLGIPRLKLRRKTTSETIKPLLVDLEEVIRFSGSLSSIIDGRSLINAVSRFVVRSGSWAKSFDNQKDESRKCDVSFDSDSRELWRSWIQEVPS